MALYYHELDCPAYGHLSVYGRALLVELRQLYNGSNNGEIIMSVRQAGKSLNCNKDTAAKALSELQDKGWISLETEGYFSPIAKKANEWRITNQPYKREVGTKDYLRWKPIRESNSQSH